MGVTVILQFILLMIKSFLDTLQDIIRILTWDRGILSTFAMILVPNAGQVVSKACQALLPGGRISILDMAWPENWSIHWRHAFFWLKPFGVTEEILRNKPWESVWNEIETNLEDVALKRFWFRMMYFISGVRR